MFGKCQGGPGAFDWRRWIVPVGDAIPDRRGLAKRRLARRIPKRRLGTTEAARRCCIIVGVGGNSAFPINTTPKGEQP